MLILISLGLQPARIHLELVSAITLLVEHVPELKSNYLCPDSGYWSEPEQFGYGSFVGPYRLGRITPHPRKASTTAFVLRSKINGHSIPL